MFWTGLISSLVFSIYRCIAIEPLNSQGISGLWAVIQPEYCCFCHLPQTKFSDHILLKWSLITAWLSLLFFPFCFCSTLKIYLFIILNTHIPSGYLKNIYTLHKAHYGFVVWSSIFIFSESNLESLDHYIVGFWSLEVQ